MRAARKSHPGGKARQDLAVRFQTRSHRKRWSADLKGFAPMPPAPFFSDTVVWRRSGIEAKLGREQRTKTRQRNEEP